MLKLNKEILNNLYLSDMKRQYPSFPVAYIPPPKYSDKTANELTKCIIEFLNLSGHQAERISSMGRMIDKSERVTDILGRERTIGSMTYIPGTSTKGTADISSIIYTNSVKIEVKIGADKQSAVQKKYQQSVERAGGVYIIAKDFDGFIEDYRKIITNGRLVCHSTLQREFIVVGTNKIQYLDDLTHRVLSDNQIKPYL